MAKNRKLLTARGISKERAIDSGLPVSIASARANFSRLHSIRSAMHNRIVERSPRLFRPIDECFLRCSYGTIFFPAVGDFEYGLPVAGCDVIEITPADGLREFAIDKILIQECEKCSSAENPKIECRNPKQCSHSKNE